MEVTKEDLDIAPKEGQPRIAEPKNTSAELIKAFDAALAQARAALAGPTTATCRNRGSSRSAIRSCRKHRAT